MKVHLMSLAVQGRYGASSALDIVDVPDSPELVDLLNQGQAVPANDGHPRKSADDRKGEKSKAEGEKSKAEDEKPKG